MKRGARWAVLSILGALLGLSAFTPVSAFALDGQCGSYQLPDGVRAQLFGKADCKGGQVAVGTSGDADRADFKAFASVDGRTVDFDRANTLALRGGNCVRLFVGANYTGENSGLMCTQTNMGVALGGFADKASSMRVCALERQANCNANGGNGGDTPPTTSPPPPTTPDPTPGPNPGPGDPVPAPDGESDYSLPPGATAAPRRPAASPRPTPGC